MSEWCGNIFCGKVNQGESLVSWLNWLTEPPAVCWSVIMGDLSPSCKGVYWSRPEAFRTGPPSCPVQGMFHRNSHICTKSINHISTGIHRIYIYIYVCALHAHNLLITHCCREVFVCSAYFVLLCHTHLSMVFCAWFPSGNAAKNAKTWFAQWTTHGWWQFLVVRQSIICSDHEINQKWSKWANRRPRFI